jgi:hypothetical protein
MEDSEGRTMEEVFVVDVAAAAVVVVDDKFNDDDEDILCALLDLDEVDAKVVAGGENALAKCCCGDSHSSSKSETLRRVAVIRRGRVLVVMVMLGIFSKASIIICQSYGNGHKASIS